MRLSILNDSNDNLNQLNSFALVLQSEIRSRIPKILYFRAMMIHKRNILLPVVLTAVFCTMVLVVSAQKPQQPYIAYHQLVVQAEEAILDEDYQIST